MGREMTGNMTGKLLAVSKKTIARWTKTQRENIKKEKNRKIIEYYLRGWNSEKLV